MFELPRAAHCGGGNGAVVGAYEIHLPEVEHLHPGEACNFPDLNGSRH